MILGIRSDVEGRLPKPTQVSVYGDGCKTDTNKTAELEEKRDKVVLYHRIFSERYH